MTGAPPPDQIGGLIRETFRAMVSRVEQEFDHDGLALSQWLALRLIDEGRISCIGDVNKELGLESGASTRLVDQLENKKMLVRRRSEYDRRVVKILITDDGRKFVVSMQPRLLAFWKARLSSFSAGELNQLFSLLSRLRDRLAVDDA